MLRPPPDLDDAHYNAPIPAPPHIEACQYCATGSTERVRLYSMWAIKCSGCHRTLAKWHHTYAEWQIEPFWDAQTLNNAKNLPKTRV